MRFAAGTALGLSATALWNKTVRQVRPAVLCEDLGVASACRGKRARQLASIAAGAVRAVASPTAHPLPERKHLELAELGRPAGQLGWGATGDGIVPCRNGMAWAHTLVAVEAR